MLFIYFLVVFFVLLSFVILFAVEIGLFMVVVVCLYVPKLNRYAFLPLKTVFKRLLGIG